MVPQWLIERKRDGATLTPEELREFIAAYADGTLPDYQMAAFAMAVFFQGMTFEEVTVLTDAMMRSGDVLDFSDLGVPTADKHSTGGIGDKVSLPLAPLVACHEVAVPMISGRGLGLTGGTLDKLEAIPGYRADLTVEAFRSVLRQVGCSIIGQTDRLAPVDRKLYALRDVTGTVPSIPLIAASILSKKLAEGADALVFDVKCGEGAFMRNVEDARRLAKTLMAIARNMGRRVSTFLTAMDQPLGRSAGNALEVVESVQVLRGEGPADLVSLTLELGTEMLCLAHPELDRETARERLPATLASGAALERFLRMVEAQGGDPRSLEDPAQRLPRAPVVVEVPAHRRGFVGSVSAAAIGRVVLLLGGGRRRTEDRIDPSVGIDRLVKVGERVDAGAPLMRLHARTRADADAVLQTALDAVAIGTDAPAAPPLIVESRLEHRR